MIHPFSRQAKDKPDQLALDVAAAEARQKQKPVKTFVAGLDLGQTNDYSALAVVEKVSVLDDVLLKQFNAFHVRHLQRWRGVPYETVVADVCDLVAKVSNMAGQPTALVVDGSGVGRPVVEMLRRSGLHGRIFPVLITAGQVETAEDRFGYRHVSKGNLVSVMEVLVGSKRPQRFSIAPSLKDAKTLGRELLNFTRKTTAKGNETYEAVRESVHDDLVLAVALACWHGERGQRRLAMTW